MEMLRLGPGVGDQGAAVQLQRTVAHRAVRFVLEPGAVVALEAGVDQQSVCEKLHLLEAERGPLRVEMGLTRRQRLITAIAQAVHQCILVAPGHAVLIADASGAVGRLAGGQAGTRSNAGRTGGVGCRERHALNRQQVEKRRLDDGMAEAAQAIAAPLIGEDQAGYWAATGCSQCLLGCNAAAYWLWSFSWSCSSRPF